MKFEDRVIKHEYKFSDTEDLIVCYIEKNKPEITKISIKTLAEKFFTVPNTIVRLSKKMGYDGFSHLKNALKEELSTDDYIEYEINKAGLHVNINKTLKLLDYTLLAKVSTLITKSKQTIVYTEGDNVPIVESTVKEVTLVDRKIMFYKYRHDLAYHTERFGDNDVLFIISLTGDKQVLLDACVLAKARGGIVVSLTHLSDNPLKKVADINLFCYSPPLNINNYNTTDRVTMQLVLRALTETHWRQHNLF
ncbi:MAG: hypothetical protein ATN34_01695 [Epulopiscium sp. Nele67-Bin002]|nr:MAG: hypothetical protein ATN34_01695 [Epulopiscium sp. Nele67-Bin002]OON93030.1 MAG: hypothetical protein ATN33_06235 [Epulopiscium sp. Nele67-Bin001]